MIWRSRLRIGIKINANMAMPYKIDALYFLGKNPSNSHLSRNPFVTRICANHTLINHSLHDIYLHLKRKSCVSQNAKCRQTRAIYVCAATAIFFFCDLIRAPAITWFVEHTWYMCVYAELWVAPLLLHGLLFVVTRLRDNLWVSRSMMAQCAPRRTQNQ